MATQYSNKPIVTNGLVYALDFGNQKSYVSGSTSARSLLFSLETSSFLSVGTGPIPNLVSGLLEFNGNSTTGSMLVKPTNIDALGYGNKEYTIQTIVRPKGANLITYDSTLFAQGGGNPNYLTLGASTLGVSFGSYTPGIGEGGLGRTYTGLSQLTHVTFRHRSGSYDLFINGVPVTASLAVAGASSAGFSTPSLGGANSGGTFNGPVYTGSVGNFYVYNRSLSSDEIYSNYLIAASRYGLLTRPKPYSLDENAYLFLQTAGITDPIITSSINTFVLGLKSASLWDKMIAIYPFVGTGSVGVNLTGSHRWNLKEPSLVTYPLSFTGSWNGSVSGSTPSGSRTNITAGGITPSRQYPNYENTNAHLSILSYDTPTSSSMLAGTGMTREVAVSTLAGDYGTPAAAYSVRKVRTAYSGALMDVRRSIDNVTSSIGYVSNGDLDTGSLLDWVLPGRSTLPGNYSGLAAAYSLRKVSGSYTGSAIDVRRDSDNTTGSIGFDASGNLDTGTLLAFVTGSANTGSGYVTQWYDQSGNNRHATQTTSSRQPLIVSSGSLITSSAKPALRFNGTSTNLKTNTFSAVSQPFTTFTHVKYQNLVTYNFTITHGNEIGIIGAYNAISGHWIRAGVALYEGTLAASNTPYLYYALFSGSNSQIAINGNTATTGNAGTNQFAQITIGSDTDDEVSTFIDGFISEHLEYYSDQSSNKALIENNINNYYSIYTSSNAGYVARWYDQSGNNIHASQSVNGSQPLIVLSGSVISDNSRVGIYFNDSAELVRSALSVSQVGQYTVYTPYDDISYNVWGQPYGDVYWKFGGTNNGFIQLFSSTRRESYPAAMPTSGPQLFSSFHSGNNMTSFLRGVSKGTDTTAAFSSTGLIYIGAQSGRALSGSIKEIIIYNSADTLNRESIEYGINNYYNIYPQTSSFTTSSFAIYATTSSISASINNDIQSGITSAGPLGLITVSRTGSNSLTITRNGVTSSFTVPASGALSTGIYLGAINNNGLALANSPYNISFASIGTGLTGNETKTLNSLVRQLQVNLQRLPSTYTVSTYPNAIAAFSLRKLLTIYTGSAIEVRRSSDNATLSIGFNSYGNLDTVSLLSFVGTSSVNYGYVTQWYDQSGNNNHLSQSTAASQPLIVNSGAVVTAQTFQLRESTGPNGFNNNTLPAIYFNGRSLGINRTLYSTNQISYYTVFNLGLSENTSADGYSVMATNTEAGSSAWSWYTTGGGPSGYINMFQQAGSARREGFPSNMPKGGTVLYSGYHTGSAYTVYVNNVSKGTDTQQQFGSGSFLTVGGGNTYQFAGSIQEIVFYATGSTANNTGIQDSINTYYQVY